MGRIEYTLVGVLIGQVLMIAMHVFARHMHDPDESIEPVEFGSRGQLLTSDALNQQEYNNNLFKNESDYRTVEYVTGLGRAKVANLKAARDRRKALAVSSKLL